MSCIRPEEAGTATVCGVEYRILEGTDIMILGDGVRGAVHAYTNTLILDRELGKSQKELTLLHELVHAIDDALDIGLCEQQTRMLGAGLYGIQYKGPRKRDKVRTMRGVFYG